MSSWISSSRLLRLLVFTLLVMGGCSLPGVADGDSTHRFVSAFGGPGEGAGEFALAAPVLDYFGGENFEIAGSGIAVDNSGGPSQGDVYVADTGNRRVDEFTGAGTFIRAFGKEVNKTEVTLHGTEAQQDVCSGGLEECQQGTAGSSPGALEAPKLVAVDNSGGPSEGDVYVGDGVGSEAQNEIQRVVFNGATGGTFTLTYEGHETSPIPFEPEKGANDAVNTREALEAATSKSGVFKIVEEDTGRGDVIGLRVQFVGTLAESATPLLGCSGAELAPAGTKCEVLLDVEGSKPANEVVSKFSEDGVLEGSWATGGQLNGTCKETTEPLPCSNGELVPFEGQLNGLAVDSAGTLWVYMYGDAKMYGFEAGGGFSRDCTLYFGSASGIASGVNPGEVYVDVASKVERRAHLCEKGSETVETVAEGRSTEGRSTTPTGVAVGGPGEYVLEGKDVFEDVFMDLGDAAAEAAHGVSEPIAFGPLTGGAGLGVNREGGVFVASASEDELDFFGVSLEAETLPASGVAATAATLNGEVDAEGTEVVSCVFQYGETTGYGSRVPCEPSGPITGATPVKVHAPVKGLTPGTAYHYRLRLVNKDGEALETNDEPLRTEVAGVVEEAATVDVGPTSARLTARVNPEGVGNTKCRIEYGTSTAYGASAGCEPGEALGSGSAGVAVSLALEGLAKGTTYHWRVVLSDEHDASIPGADNAFVYIAPGEPPEVQGGCPNEGLRGESDLDPATGVALSRELPDCRAYEMVTPAQKNAALLSRVFSSPAAQINAEGTRVIASSLQCFAQSPSCTAARGINYGAPYEFSRGPTGWSTSSLAPPADVHEDYGYWYASAQTGMALFSAPVAGQVSDTLYARQPEGALEAIGPLSEALPLEEFDSGLRLVATADLSHVLFWDETKEGLWPSLISNGLPLYEYTGGANSKPFLVGVEGSEREKNIKTIGHCTTLALPSSLQYLLGAEYALSADGQVVYFDVCPAGEEDGAVGGELYARVDGEGADARTVGVSVHAAGGGAGAEECSGSCASSPASGAGLEGVSEDGSRVFFTSTQRLTNDATEDVAGDAASTSGCAGVTGVGGCNLYLFEDPREGGRLVDVSAGDTSGLGPQVQGVMAVSADGSHVYFVARGVLAGANLEGREPSEGADNLYMYERDEAFPAGRTVFVATLPGEKGEAPDEYETEQWKERKKAANVTADGGFLLFTSHGALTADDARGLGPEQVYRYDAATGLLARVSIGEHGFNDDGNANGSVGGARIVRPESWVGQPRRDPSMSDDGSMVFFQSPVALTARALNDVPTNDGGTSVDLAQNIYEWEAPGTHGCGEAAGCIYLISDGRDATESGSSGTLTRSSVELLGTDTSGQDVFFTTADRLVGQDTDSELDYYDARVDGGFPAPKEETGCQSGEQESQPGVCRGEASEPSVFGPLASATLTGPGNVTPGEAKHLVEKPPVKTAAQIRAEKLKKALRTCKKRYAKSKKKRAACEKAAKKRYGPTHRAKRPKKSSRRRK